MISRDTFTLKYESDQFVQYASYHYVDAKHQVLTVGTHCSEVGAKKMWAFKEKADFKVAGSLLKYGLKSIKRGFFANNAELILARDIDDSLFEGLRAGYAAAEVRMRFFIELLVGAGLSNFKIKFEGSGESYEVSGI